MANHFQRVKWLNIMCKVTFFLQKGVQKRRKTLYFVILTLYFVILTYTIVHFPNGIQIAIKELNLLLSRR